ncbi:hypothetical protein FVA74_13345 [Salinibacterium sp. dk2585]|uniref:hypothetical protein n=1 Tax=unclassified Salinibacterium TaxID=2632331 RepID=UPI0011C24D44|nr:MULTISPECIES: hypothetical protein [unclassified Salinibacterium]QEE62447.1 hypothetical protein FVA74_13345 [Salinibacterium sp. dk2585]TXK52670.1 hypothetical protein FVP63_12050 [Salinibacterium sp. dk5596]
MSKAFNASAAFGIGLVVALATVQPASASQAASGETNQGSTANSTSEFIDAAAAAASTWQQFGLTAGDFVTLPEEDREYFEEVAAIALSNAEDPNLSPTPATPCTQGGRAAYAAEIAAINSARDQNAGTAAEETMYMYLSHYIDMSPSHVGSSCNHNSGAPRYSAWITDSDRSAYNQFLSTTNLAGAVSDFGTALSMAPSLATSRDLTLRLETLGDYGAALVELTSLGFTADTARSLVPQLIESRVAGDSPEAAIADLEAALMPNISAPVLPAAVGLIAAAVSPSLLPAVVEVGLAVLPVFTMLGPTIVNWAAWSGLIYSSNSRVSGRMMRYLGM